MASVTETKDGNMMRRSCMSIVGIFILSSVSVQAQDISQDQRRLWSNEQPVPKSEDLSQLKDVSFHVIKPHEPEADGGYEFLHGVALVWHQGKLYASWGHNRGKENTATEEARGRISTDGGKTWGETFTIDASDSKLDRAVSHGVFLSHEGRLWAFMGAFYGKLKKVHTRAYLLNEQTGQWEFQGVVIQDGFWPMEEPRKLANGNWIMGGLMVGRGNPPAVAISQGDDFSAWKVIPLERDTDQNTWGESTTIVTAEQVTNISRFGARAVALVATSKDFGETWTQSVPSNMPMATSKPYAGILSNGQRFLVCTSSANSGGRRSPLTIAVSNPGEADFTRIYKIRDAVHAGGTVDSHPRAKLSYPYVIEQDGMVYVGYSNSGGREGMNINSAELAVFPISALQQ